MKKGSENISFKLNFNNFKLFDLPQVGSDETGKSLMLKFK